jgi:hypothetical protein
LTFAIALLASCATASLLAAPIAAKEPTAAAADGNVAPVAEDDTATVTTGGSVVIPVLTNDYDPDGGSQLTLTVVGVVDAPTAGTAVVESNAIKYTADGAFVGTDTFTYEISDGDLTDQASVTVTVTDTPNDPPATTPDAARTRWGRPIVVDVAANDIDPEGDELSAIDVRRPDHGRAEIKNGKVRFTPVGEYIGPSVMEYTVQDERGATANGELTVQVKPSFTVKVLHRTKAIAKRTMTIRGRISTRMDGPVVARLQRWREGAWRTLNQRTVRGDDRFELRWRPEQPGREALRLTAHWASGHSDQTARRKIHVDARFDPDVSRITAKDVPHTWRPGCPVGPSELRAIRMNYWDYHGRLQRGTLIGAAWVTHDYIAVFRRAFAAKFMIKKMYPADRYGGVDERAMRAGNTSAFNCRHVTGNPYRMSQHSYGNAIDINTFENPYVTGSRVYPAKAAVRYYYHRERNLKDPGVITRRSAIARALWGQGWAWGARWALPDYQHWSSNGG